MFRVVLGSAGHPRGGLDAAAGHGVIRVLLVRTPRVVGDDDVGLEQAEEEDEALAQFGPRDVVHHVVVVIEVERARGAERLADRLRVAPVRHHGLGVRARAGHVVVGHADHVAGRAFVDQLQHRAGGKERDVVGMRLDGDHDLARTRLALARPLDDQRRVAVELLQWRPGRPSGCAGAAPGVPCCPRADACDTPAMPTAIVACRNPRRSMSLSKDTRPTAYGLQPA